MACSSTGDSSPDRVAPRVLVTGAHGFIARHVADAFRARGWRVRGSVRALGGGMAAGGLAGFGELVSSGALDADTDWRPALEGVQVVVHLAARTHLTGSPGRDQAAYRRANAEASEALAHAAARAGVRRLVFASSIGVNGHETRGRGFAEGDPANPQTPYARSKWDAERRLERVQAETGLEVVRLRFPLVYGPRAPGNFSRLVRLARSGLPLPLAAVRNARTLLYVENAADAVWHAASHPGAAGELFLVADDQDASTPELLRAVGAHLGVPVRLFGASQRALWLAARALGRGVEARALLHSLRVQNGKLAASLGWRPPFSLQQGLERSLSVAMRADPRPAASPPVPPAAGCAAGG